MSYDSWKTSEQETGRLPSWYDDEGNCKECGTYHADRPEFPCVCDNDPKDRCPDCGKLGERVGHQTCQYPQDHD